MVNVFEVASIYYTSIFSMSCLKRLFTVLLTNLDLTLLGFHFCSNETIIYIDKNVALSISQHTVASLTSDPGVASSI